ncbi:hypothetical protein [Pontibacter sp. G13]|uniref:hypothetical protein n=1 Tax=Pontibacter sp. G13 TaxID=3074898 RepID=UPI00288C05B8|nr:hypothetical protein [Pontibacter sp. G13]WNJ18710.1 hypothetical protein RJD25_27965 [Pontibacter sp. G13]
MPRLLVRLIFLLGMAIGLTTCNPFAPALDQEGLSRVDLLGDPSSVDGFFQLFKNAYELRDTTLYGSLFTPDFLFAYYDPDLGQEFQWDRDTEMGISQNLFSQVIQITLDWNYYVQIDTTDTTGLVVRSFNLTITEDEDNAYIGSGRARMELKRSRIGEAWKASYWFDDSDF